MSAPIIQVDYDMLADVAGQFDQQSADIEQMTSRLVGLIDVLRGGNWAGTAADAFYKEMDDELLPTLERLQDAFADSSIVMEEISAKFDDAETEAASLFDDGQGDKRQGGRRSKPISSGSRPTGSGRVLNNYNGAGTPNNYGGTTNSSYNGVLDNYGNTPDTPSDNRTDTEIIRDEINVARSLLDDPSLSPEDRQQLEQAINQAEASIDALEAEINAGGDVQKSSAALSALGLAATGILADDATVVGVADDPLLIPIALAALGIVIYDAFTSTDFEKAAEAVSESLEVLSQTIDDFIFESRGGKRNVIDTGIIGEAQQRATELGISIEEALRQMYDEESGKGGDSSRRQKIRSTQKGIGERNKQKRGK